MNTLPAALLGSYQAGARAARAKSAGALALGATALAALPSEADAQIIVSSTNSSPVTISATGSHYLFLNLQSAIFPVSSGSGIPYLGARSNFGDGVWTYAAGFNNTGGKYTWAFVNTDDARKFAPGELIDSSATFGAREYLNGANSGVVSSWISASGYLAFRAALGDGNHYGWAKVTTNADASSLTLLALGFNTSPGGGIFAGSDVIPEPASTAALLGLGATGLALYRKRKNFRRAA